jgi:hypothetical protein
MQHGGLSVEDAVFTVDPAEIKSGFCGDFGNGGIGKSDDASLAEFAVFHRVHKLLKTVVAHKKIPSVIRQITLFRYFL